VQIAETLVTEIRTVVARPCANASFFPLILA
jgi:hypothetical protein